MVRAVVTLRGYLLLALVLCMVPTTEARVSVAFGKRVPLLTAAAHQVRGGATGTAMESDDEDYEEDDVDPKLTKSAVKSTLKASKKATASAKKTVNSKLSSKKGGLRIPYIVKACLNPFTLWSMTTAYWASLFSLNYLKEEASSGAGLRSALEEKAKKSGGAGARKGKRQMRPGQAKTLSDLPQLSQ